jgi:two-component system sensor histidine kinase/response regulator
MPNTVKVPKELEPVFQKAQEYVSKYFKERIEDPSKGTIEIFRERYILIRAASMSVDFFETVKNLYRDKGDEEALNVARSLLFDIAHAIGKADAKNFHKRMELKDPIEKLSAGPVHFSHSGWAFVDIFPESKPSPDENYFLIYDHPFSFEADAWLKAGKKSDFPVCVMNAGYSSGWCEESFGVPLVASEIMCRGKGDDVCRFIMAHPSKIEDYIKEYLKREPELAKKVTRYEIPGFFKRKHMEEELRRAHDQLEKRVQERTAELAKANKALQAEITERKRTEEALRESEGKYKTLVENIPQKIFIKNKNSVYISCNENYAKDLRIKPDEIAGKTDYDFYPKDLAEKYKGDDKRIMEAGTAEDIEERYIQNGQEVCVHTVKTPVKDENGNVIGILGIFWDITESKRAEELLRTSEAQLSNAMKIAQLGYWEYDVADDLFTFNDHFYAIFRTTAEQVGGYTMSSARYAELFVHPDDMSVVGIEIRKALETKDPHFSRQLEHRIIYADGEIGYISVRFFIVKDNQGRTVKTYGANQDITERKRAEEALRESEEKYRDLFENANDLIQSVDEDGRFVYVNKEWKQVMGYSDEEVKSLIFTDILRKDQIPHCMELFKKVVAGETVDNVETVFVTKEGKEIFVSGAINPRIKDGKFVATRAILRDITERKRAEENLRKAKEEAEVANRLKSEFLANMSHEIRTPMNAIIGMIDLSLDTELTEEQQEYLNVVKESAYALLGLLDDILDLSKIEVGRLEFETIDFDLRTTVEGVANTLAHRASTKELELACMIHNEVPTLLRGDPARLRQILMNLGGNAIKFTEKGEVVIRAELSEETEDRATLLFSVTDTGPGIPKDRQEEIFESFVQVDGSATRKYGGAGLGLSISKRLAELMGGHIGVDSQPGKGSRFWFSLTFEKQKEFKEISLTLPPDIRGMRILVVDDNETNQTILIKMLESFGCQGEAAGSGAEALRLLKKAAHREKLFDLVILDMQMPEMDGEETLGAIKNDPEIRDVVVILLTSVGMRGDAARMEALGCAGYLLKPVQQSQLFDTIITVLSQQKSKAREEPSRIVTRHTIAEQKRQTIHILLAEDNPLNQKFAVTLLKKAGYPVDAVGNGRLAVEALKRTAYNLILMDVQMPEMNGFEATKAIRKREGESRHTPIIAMTAHAMKGDRERCLQAGMDDYIPKPIEPQVLFDTIERWAISRVHPALRFDPFLPHRVSGRDAGSKTKGGKPFTSHLSPPEGGKDVSTGSELARSEFIESVEPIDFESALRRCGGDKGFFKEMIGEFLDYAPKQLEILAEAIKTGDAKVVEREAHSLKGASGNLGAKPIADLALQLEILGRTGDLAGAKEIIHNLRTEFERSGEYIKKMLEVVEAPGTNVTKEK